MVHVALHQGLVLQDGDPVTVIESVARDGCASDIDILQFENSIDFHDKVVLATGEPTDIVVLPYQLPGMLGTVAVQEAREKLPLLRSVIFDDTLDHVSEAVEAGANSFMVSPVTSEKFQTVMACQFERILELHGRSFLLNTRAGLYRIPYDKVLYCETSGHDQIVHLLDGSSAVGRYSSQGMFDLLAVDKRFYKVGSSYIVNLNEVAQAHIPNGTMTLTDGTMLNIPSRLRKAFESALLGVEN